MKQPSQARTATKKHVILFLAANPPGTRRMSLDEEAQSILEELQRTGHRDRFDFVTRWAAKPIDLLRAMRELKPTVVHFAGHGGRSLAGAATMETTTAAMSSFRSSPATRRLACTSTALLAAYRS